MRYCAATAFALELIVAALTAIERLTPTTFTTLVQPNLAERRALGK